MARYHFVTELRIGTDRQRVWDRIAEPHVWPFSRNHDVLMRDFGAGLARVSGGVLLEIDNHTVAPSAPGFYRLPARGT